MYPDKRKAAILKASKILNTEEQSLITLVKLSYFKDEGIKLTTDEANKVMNSQIKKLTGINLNSKSNKNTKDKKRRKNRPKYKKHPKKTHYAVKKGKRSMIIVGSWAECKRLTHGFRNAVFKGFYDLESAEDWLYADDIAIDEILDLQTLKASPLKIVR